MKKELTLILFSIILLSSPFIANPFAFAHNAGLSQDPPGAEAPRIKVTITIDGVHLGQSMDDPTKSDDSELVLAFGFKHKGHEKIVDALIFDHDYDRITESYSAPYASTAHIVWGTFPEHIFDEPKIVYEHEECTEMSDIVYYFALNESDQDPVNTAAGLTTTIVSTLGLIPGAGWATAGAVGTIGGIFTSLLGLNGDDELGLDFDVKYGPEDNIVTDLEGPDGTAKIYWTIKTEEIPDPDAECVSSTTSSTSSAIDSSVGQSHNFSPTQNDVHTAFDSVQKLFVLNEKTYMEQGLSDMTTAQFNFERQKVPEKIFGYVDALFNENIQQQNFQHASDAVEFRNKALDFEDAGNYEKSLGMYENAFLAGFGHDVNVPDQIPSWIKQNADWWSKGLISDRDFATGLGFMVKEKIIKVDNVEVDSDGTVALSDDLLIPDWIRTNAQWWVSGAISDGDFKQGIQFMIKEEIVSFKEKSLLSSDDMFRIEGHLGKEMDSVKSSIEQLREEYNLPFEILSELIFEKYKEQKWNEVAFNYLLQIKNYEAKIYNRASDAAWNLYSEEKLLENQKLAEKIQTLKTKGDEDVKKSLEILKNSQQQIETLKNLAKQNNISILDLERNTEEQNSLLDSPLEFHGLNDILEGYDVAQDAANNAQLYRDLMGEIPTSKSDVRIELDSEDDVDIQIFTPGYCNPSEKCDDLGADMIKNGDSALRSSTSDLQKVIDLDSGESIQVSPTSESDYDTSDEETEMEQLSSITILEIGGAQYPIAQFTLWQWDGECDDAWHYHTSSGHAVNLELTGMGDPDPENCGFGKLSEITSYNTWMTQSQMDTFYELTGINPAGNEAQMGGSGP